MSDTALGGWRFNGTGLRLTRVRGGPLAGEALSALCDQFHRGSLRYVMVNRSATAYTDTINCG